MWEKLVEIDLNDGEEGERLVKVSNSLSKEEGRKLIALLREYKDVFSWSCQEMLGLNPSLVTHKLKVAPNAKHVKQPIKKYHLDIEEMINAEVNKLLKAGVDARPKNEEPSSGLCLITCCGDAPTHTGPIVGPS